ncbi:MAG: C45 family autoproteolytic acyltransferase/hydrolase [Gemmataceae bacterium]
MATAHPTIPVHDFSGTPAQIGAAHGEAERERIRAYAERLLDFYLRHASMPLTEETMWGYWAGQVAANEREAPELVEEMRGIARGAGVSFERVFLLNSLLDLNSFRYLPMTQNIVGCTTFAATAAADTGLTLLGQTYDMAAFHEDYVALLRLRPTRGPRQLVFTFAGIVGAAGLNEHGLGVNINYLSPRDVGLGRLHSVVVRQILAGDQLADALTPAVMPPRAGGAHFLIGDADGTLLSVETTARRHAVFYPDGNAIGHTNHYLSDWLKNDEYLRAGSIGGSLARYAALRRFLRQRGDSLTLNTLQELTRNHTSYPRSICAHGTDREPEAERGRTVAALIQVLAERTMHLTRGCPCENTYHAVSL